MHKLCRMRRARAPYPLPTSTQSPHTMWPASPQLPEAHTAPLGVPDDTPQGQSSDRTALMLAWAGHVAAQRASDGGAVRRRLSPVHPPNETVPEHLDRTSTAAGPSVVCLGAVRSGAVIGGHMGSGGTAEVCTLGPVGRENGALALTVRGPPRPPPPATPHHTSAALALLDTTSERG